ARLARADGVEESDDDSVEAGLRVAEREDLADGLGGGVAPPGRRSRAKNALRALVKRTTAVLAIDLRGRCVKDLASELSGGRYDDVVAAHVPEHRVDRAVDDQLNAHRRSHVEAHVGGLHELADELEVADRALDEFDQPAAQRAF